MRSIAVKLSGGGLCGDSLECLSSDVRLASGSHLSTTDPGLTFYSANDMTIFGSNSHFIGTRPNSSKHKPATHISLSSNDFE